MTYFTVLESELSVVSEVACRLECIIVGGWSLEIEILLFWVDMLQLFALFVEFIWVFDCVVCCWAGCETICALALLVRVGLRLASLIRLDCWLNWGSFVVGFIWLVVASDDNDSKLEVDSQLSTTGPVALIPVFVLTVFSVTFELFKLKLVLLIPLKKKNKMKVKIILFFVFVCLDFYLVLIQSI